MKMPAAAILLLILLFLPASSFGLQCSSYSTETGCESAGCSWCDRCAGKEINNYGSDRCVESPLSCTYSCSRTCGANCTADADCSVNLTDTTCFFGGRCGVCSCSYQSVSCQQNGTVITESQTCFFGARYCTSTGCSVSSCTLQSGQICDPTEGCVSCGSDRCDGETFIIDKKCSGNDIIGRQINYACTGGLCNSTRTQVLVEKCKNGCEGAKCNDELCNIAGLNTNCNEFDGFYGEAYCKGNDIYKGYRDYSCGSNECVYANVETKLENCSKALCQNGRCYTGSVINITNVTDLASDPIPSTANQTAPELEHSIPAGRLYSGMLFGANDIRIANGRSGQISFRVLRSNGLGTLMIEQSDANGVGQVVFRTKSTGNFTVSFSGDLRMYTTGSGWIFFMPAVYDIGRIDIR